ncbi:MAG: VOC family protein [Erysipelotrichaceae bacterium]|nr:VOC family protein [Erysipelotrichaceae bacterium]
MLFQSIMHVTFFAEDLNRSIRFYEKLGGKVKMAVKYKAYLDQPESSFYQKALETPEDYCIVYVEIAPGQFVELYPKGEEQKEHIVFNRDTGYSHFAVVVDDIFKARDYLTEQGIPILIEPKIGNSRTWQLWIADPDDNRIEVMQYTPESFQLTGHID